MKVKDFVRKLNFESDAIVEVCNLNVSLDNRTRLSRRELGRVDLREFGDMKLNSFSVVGGKLVIYAI